MQERQVQFLGQEDPLEKEMTTHSSILAREIPWTEEPGGLQSMGSKRADMSERLRFTTTDLQYFASRHSKAEAVCV